MFQPCRHLQQRRQRKQRIFLRGLQRTELQLADQLHVSILPTAQHQRQRRLQRHRNWQGRRQNC